jgi:MFS family permease
VVRVGELLLQAIFAAYTFMFGVLVVTGARLGDDRGHGNTFLAGLAGFTASSLLCGLAPDAATLLAGRLIQGACGALMTPHTLQVLGRDQPHAGALDSSTALVATVVPWTTLPRSAGEIPAASQMRATPVSTPCDGSEGVDGVFTRHCR